MNEGWICPRCGRVNAPFTTQCNCKPSIQNNIIECECNHKWVLIKVTDTTNEYKCVNCGETKTEEYSSNNGIMTTK